MHYDSSLRMHVLAGSEGSTRMWAIGRGGLYFFERGFRVALTKRLKTVTFHRPDRLLPGFVRRFVCRRREHPLTEWVVGYDAFECRCGKRRVNGMLIAR